MDNDSSFRIVAALRAWIAGSVPGARLPTSRALVAKYGASPVTVQKALRTLVAQGLIETRPGAGTFVRAVRTARPLDYSWQTAAMRSPHSRLSALSPALRAAPQGAIALHAGYPDRELLPERLIRSALARAARSDAALIRSSVAGLPELQSWFAHELGAATPVGVTPPLPSDVIVLPGSQSGLATIFRALVTAGRPLLMESPTYWGAIQAAAQAGVEVIPIPSGPDGPDPDALARAFQETGSRVFYAQPTYANPTGAQWSDAATTQILDVVRAHGAFLVEDDWAHDFGIDTDPRPVAARDDAGHVVYVRSLTKSVSPSVRIAAVIARGPARERILADRGAESMYVSGVLQAAALDVVTQPGWQTHLRNLRPQLRARRDLLLTSLREHAPDAHIATVPAGGLNLWARLPDATNLDRLVADCEAAGVMIAAGTSWFPAEPTGPFIRLNYSGPNPGAFADGARIIGQAVTSNH
ncbi:PLP-dependent aminotransferase family protein [Cryobacterium psychrotolerans]|uniref:aminotransferase-like domain-containing protein n=1 Tax=Cryobacterium psychrotolerans TaxID=386301 RepID=UPI000B82F048|nr:PLP-dependent aminotransferase family protein [Cryobacterium psychrotolerans]TFD91529.1 PLP-dependent aminotransferase family protein [Cryobacterium psychrotolerans]